MAYRTWAQALHTARSRSRARLMEARGGGGGGGGTFGIVNENEASPLPLNKALKGSRRATGLISL